ncbi:MAG: hypothetical protein ACKO37_09430 [Vampirovibrionales bacterium]
MMMLRIQGNTLPPEPSQTLGIQSGTAQESKDIQASRGLQGVKPTTLLELQETGGQDEAFRTEISPDALSRYSQQESVSAGMVERVKREDAFEQPDKVAQFKQLMAEGRIGEYLNTLDPSAVAQSILAHPFNPLA